MNRGRQERTQKQERCKGTYNDREGFGQIIWDKIKDNNKQCSENRTIKGSEVQKLQESEQERWFNRQQNGKCEAELEIKRKGVDNDDEK